MEIHAPHKPILTVREALAHLLIVTVGILIALSFEGAREWVEHRSLAAEARENIHQELAANAKELETFLKGLPMVQENLFHARDLVLKIAGGAKSLDNESVSLGFSLSSLGASSRTTAEITGAFGYMPYTDVRKYAAVYDLQAKFVRLQEEALLSFSGALASGVIFAEPEKATPQQVAAMQQRLDTMLGSLIVQQQLGDELLKAYRSAPGEH